MYALYPLIGYKTLFDVENASNFQRDYTAIGDINAEDFYGPMLVWKGYGKEGSKIRKMKKNVHFCSKGLAWFYAYSLHLTKNEVEEM